RLGFFVKVEVHVLGRLNELQQLPAKFFTSRAATANRDTQPHHMAVDDDPPNVAMDLNLAALGVEELLVQEPPDAYVLNQEIAEQLFGREPSAAPGVDD